MARDYGRIYTRFWNSADMRGVSDRGRLLATYLLTSPHSNSIGAYLLPDAYVADDLGWSMDTVAKAFAELFRNGFAARFKDGRHICVRHFLDFNPVENPNVGKAALKALEQLPDDPALLFIISGLKQYAKHLGDAFETVCERFRNIEIEPNLTQPNLNTQPPAEPARKHASKPSVSSADFAEFWKVYPRREAKGDAERAFAKAAADAPPATLIEAAALYARRRFGEDKKFTKLPATWLNKRCWEDDGIAGETIPSPEKVAEAKDRADRLMKRGKYAVSFA